MGTRLATVALLAWRSIWRHRRRTVVTVVSIAFGIALVIFAVTLNEGVYEQLVDDAVRMQSGHVTVEHPAYRDAPAIDLFVENAVALRERARAIDGVEATKIAVLGQGIARSGSGAVGVAVMGVEPAAERATSPLARNVIEGSYLTDDDGARVVVGSGLAERLRLAEGKKLVLATNDSNGNLVESLFRVAGIFRTGSDELDGYVVQAPVAAVQDLYGLSRDQVTQVGVLLDDPGDQRRVLRALQSSSESSRYAVRPWQDVLPELSAFIRLDRVTDYTFEGMLLVLILFTIFNTLLMSVIEREHEHTVLLALGTPRALLRTQILCESMFIAALGCAAGVILGVCVGMYFQEYGLDLSGMYSEGITISGMTVASHIYAKVTFAIVATVAGIVFTSTVALGALVMHRVTHGRMADVLR